MKEETKETGGNILGELPIRTLLRQFAVPSIIAMLVSALYNIVDQFFIGRSVGELGNAATNVAFPLTISCVALSLLLGIGGAAAFNLTLGGGDKEKAIYYIGNAAVLLFGSGVVLSVLVHLFLTPMLRFFGSPESVLEYAKTYTGITSLGFPFLILTNGGGHLVRADGSPRKSMLFNLSGAIINTILDPLFIFGFHMGMAGAALATILGQIFSGLLVMNYLRHYRAANLEKKHLIPSLTYVKTIEALGASSFFNQIAMLVVQIVLNKSLTYYGARSVYGEAIPLACVGIITKVNQVFFSIIIGISQGMQPIASFNYGAKNYGRVKEVYRLAMMSGCVISGVSFACFQLIPRQIIALFGSGSEEYFLFAERYFRIYLFFTCINFVQPIVANLFTSIGKPRKGIFLSLTRQLLFLLPMIIVFPLFLGIDGIMYAGPIADFVAGAVALFMVRREIRKLEIERSK
ncbi:MAG: MATE family efflux transporter [Otoolea sp.]